MRSYYPGSFDIRLTARKADDMSGGGLVRQENIITRTDSIHIMMMGLLEDHGNYIKNELVNSGYTVKLHVVDDGVALQEDIELSSIDIIMCQHEHPEFSSVYRIADQHGNIPVIAVTIDIESTLSINALSHGARDVISVNMHPRHLLLVIEKELKYSRISRGMHEYINAYHESEQRCRALLESSHDAIAYVLDGIHVFANRNYLDLFRYDSLDDIEGLPMLDIVLETEVEALRSMLINYSKPDSENSLDVKCMRDDFTEFNGHLEFSQASIDGEPCTQVILSDSTMSDVVVNELELLKTHDPTTGLYNRQAFIEELQLIIDHASAACTAGTVIYIEIDAYEDIRRSLGIESIDVIIKTIARKIEELRDGTDIQARFGDHVFTVISLESGLAKVMSKASRLLKALDTIVEIVDKSMRVTCSIGICDISSNYKTPHEVLALADMACLQAVAQGGNRFVVHQSGVTDPQEGAHVIDVHKWAISLKQALDESRFHLVYQPIVSLRNDDMIYDVAVRMKNDEGEDILPSEFLPAAERTGMIGKIDRWVLGKALRTMVTIQDEGKDIVFVIKLSDSVVVDRQLLPWVYERIKSLKIDPNRLIFQINETAAITHAKQIDHFCGTLKKMHIRIAISDFGKNSNPFNLLKTVFADYLIFSTSLTENVVEGNEEYNRLLDMVQYAHSIEKKVFARKIQNTEHLGQIFQCGFDYIQGNFLKESDVVMSFEFGDMEASTQLAAALLDTSH